MTRRDFIPEGEDFTEEETEAFEAKDRVHPSADITDSESAAPTDAAPVSGEQFGAEEKFTVVRATAETGGAPFEAIVPEEEAAAEPEASPAEAEESDEDREAREAAEADFEAEVNSDEAPAPTEVEE